MTTPADRVIEAFDGVRQTAGFLGIAPSTVSRWRMRPPRGTGGNVPLWHHDDIIRLAARLGKSLMYEDLIAQPTGRKRRRKRRV